VFHSTVNVFAIGFFAYECKSLETMFLIYFTAPGCAAFVNLYPGSQSIGADRMPQVPRDNRQACEDGCRADPTCLSYQLNTNQGDVYCWYQRDQGQLDPNQMANQQNVIEYIRTNNCSCKYPFQC